MSSSCIPTGLRLDLEMVKAAASPAGAHTSPLRAAAHSSPASSTLSEACNSSSSASSSAAAASLSLKRARTPRKRPNQTYNEAAALLAAMYPSVFPIKKKNPSTAAPSLLSRQLGGGDADLLPPLPVLADAAFLLRPPEPEASCGAKSCPSPAPVSSAFREFRDPAPSPASPASDGPGELDFDDGFDAESILDVEEAAAGGAAEGIGSILGSLTMDGDAPSTSDDCSVLSNSSINPYLRSLMLVGLAGKFELGLGFRHGRPNINQALKRRDDDGAWWMWPAVPVKDITPPAVPAKPSAPMAAAPEKKKSKKKAVKVEKVVVRQREGLGETQCKQEADATAASGGAAEKAGKAGLGLKLDHEEVLKVWSDRGPMFAEGGGPDSPNSSADVRAKLADIDLFPESGAGGIREASVMRYKEKRRTRLFSKKIRYQVRKANADCRPRMKGRFVRSPSLLKQALEEEES